MKQADKSNATRSMILAHAFEHIYEHGYNATSAQKIIKGTGLTKGAFYHHFPNKEVLLLEVIKKVLRKRVYDHMIAPMYGPGNPILILKTIFQKRIRDFSNKEKELGCPFNNLINEIGASEKAFQMALKSILEEWFQAFKFLLQRAKKEGLIAEGIDDKAVATHLICAFEGARGLRKLQENDELLEQYLNGLDLFIEGISIKTN